MPERIVETSFGKLRGEVREGIHVFKGVAYGASTAGRNRFMPPQPVPAWAGVRDALAFGPTSPQPQIRDVPLFRWYHPQVNGSEDCLTLNVYTPGVRGHDAGSGKRPVMVWLHGGGFSFGGSTADVFEGSNLARFGDVVVVTVTHRLNLFGFWYLSEQCPELADSGNAGMLDVVAALRWVRDNIASFGGDPGNVTVFGQSGGTGKISTLMAMPAARGLFHKAILQSGCALVLRTPEQAARHAHGVLSHLQYSGNILDALQKAPIEQLQAAARAGGFRFGAVVDARALPRQPFEPDATPVSADVSVIIGSAAEEATYFYRKALDRLPAHSMDDARRRVMQRLHCEVGEADRLIEAYRDSHPAATLTHIATIIESDYLYRLKCLLFAERKARQAAPVHMYLLAWQTPAMAGLYGAPHTMCPPLVFRNMHVAADLLGVGAATQALSNRMSSAWVAFAHTGKPDGAGLPPWPAYRLPQRATMVFDTDCAVVNDPLSNDRIAIAAYGPDAAYIRAEKGNTIRRSE